MNKLDRRAEKNSYWKTSQKSPGTWLDKAGQLIERHGGQVLTKISGKNATGMGAALEFTLDGQEYRIFWPALAVSSPKDESAAIRQAATFLFHDTKARVSRLVAFGPQVAFVDWMVLQNGLTIAEMGGESLTLWALPPADDSEKYSRFAKAE